MTVEVAVVVELHLIVEVTYRVPVLHGTALSAPLASGVIIKTIFVDLRLILCDTGSRVDPLVLRSMVKVVDSSLRLYEAVVP